LRRRLRSRAGRPEGGTQGGPSEVLHAVFGEALRLLVGTLGTVVLEFRGGVVRVWLVPLLLAPSCVSAGSNNKGARNEENAQAIHDGMIPCRRDARRDHSREPPETRVARHAERAVGAVASRRRGP